MSELNRINLVLNEVGKRGGLHGLFLGSDGTRLLELTDGTTICFEWVERFAKFFIYTPLAKLPSDKMSRLAMCERIAGLNCLSAYRGTVTAHLPTDAVLYQISLDTREITADHLDHALDELLSERPRILMLVEEALAQVSKEKSSTGQGAGVSVSAAPKQERAWIEELDALAKRGIKFRFAPCSENDIAGIEADCADRLPAQYRQFLTRTGRGSDLLFMGEDIFFPRLSAFGKRASDMLRIDGARFTLPNDAFVFLIHRDVQFFFFHLGSGDDPAIYRFSYEEGNKGFVKAYKSFSDFMRIYINLHANNYQTLARINAPSVIGRVQ